jgi:hypothetical protein
MPNENRAGDPPKPPTHRPSSKERQAARVAEIANKQSELKREAAERRAAREAASSTNPDEPAGS